MPHTFNVERFLNDTEVGTPHYAYGAGSRMCAGSHLANRELFTAYVRVLTAFEITQSDDVAARPIMDCIECNGTPTSLTLDPKPFKIALKPRDEAQVKQWIAESEERTKYL